MFELTRRGHVAVLQMTHGKANAMDIEFVRGLNAQVHAVQQSDARALVTLERLLAHENRTGSGFLA